MNPDVVAAIARLRTDNVLSGPQAALLNRVARRHLVSVRLEIRLLLYVGVLLLTSGVGVLVVEHQDAIGPLAIAGSLGLAALACLVWVARKASPFSWREVESPNVAFDYILLLGLLLFASTLGYVEAQFTVLGPRWAHHLLIVGVVYLLAAYRWDSRMVLGLALTTPGGVAGRVPEPDGLAGHGPRRRPSGQRDRARPRLYRVRHARGAARAQAPLRGGVRQRRARAPPRRARVRRARLIHLGCLGRCATRGGGSRHVDLVRPRALAVLRSGSPGGLHRCPEASVPLVSRQPRLPRRRAAGRRSARADLHGSPADDRAMRSESVAWERAAEVREAAEGWRRAQIIGTPTYEAIRQAYPDPCVTPSAIWRILTAVMVTAVTLCSLGALWLATRPGSTGLALLDRRPGVAAWVLTERLQASPRSARRGAAGDGILGKRLRPRRSRNLRQRKPEDPLRPDDEHGAAGERSRVGGQLLAMGEPGLRRALGPLAVRPARAAAARPRPLAPGRGRTDRPLRSPLGRPGLGALRSSRRDGPARRRGGCRVRGAQCLLVDARFVEGLREFAPVRTEPPRWLFVVAAVATAVMPVTILAWALRSRRTVLLDTGIVLAALSLVTLRQYVHVAPLWIVLTASGAALIVLALAVERALRHSPDGERGGFTADALFSDDRRQQMLQTVPVVAAFTPAAPTSPRPKRRASPAAEARSAGAGLPTSSEVSRSRAPRPRRVDH